MHEDFPVPSIPLPEPLPASIEDQASTFKPEHPSSQDTSSQNSQKENAPPDHALKNESRSPLGKALSPNQYRAVPDSQPSSLEGPAGTLPPQLLSLLSSIQSTLTTSFASAPPHTIQRLAELILRPTHHYRTLPSYLRAVDRVISVSSTAAEFPLPSINPAFDENSDAPNASYLSATGSFNNNDDGFNGAALTRIPWLREYSSTTSERAIAGDLRTESTALIDGPNGAGSLETVTVSVNGIPHLSRDGGTLRSEIDRSLAFPDQAHTVRVTRSSTAMARKEEEADEERVHARGPDEIGVEDMGPQAVGRSEGPYDVEAALGRKGEGEKADPLREPAGDRGDREADGDFLVVDADGKEAGEEGSADANSINVGS